MAGKRNERAIRVRGEERTRLNIFFIAAGAVPHDFLNAACRYVRREIRRRRVARL